MQILNFVTIKLVCLFIKSDLPSFEGKNFKKLPGDMTEIIEDLKIVAF